MNLRAVPPKPPDTLQRSTPDESPVRPYQPLTHGPPTPAPRGRTATPERCTRAHDTPARRQAMQGKTCEQRIRSCAIFQAPRVSPTLPYHYLLGAPPAVAPPRPGACRARPWAWSNSSRSARHSPPWRDSRTSVSRFTSVWSFTFWIVNQQIKAVVEATSVSQRIVSIIGVTLFR